MTASVLLRDVLHEGRGGNMGRIILDIQGCYSYIGTRKQEVIIKYLNSYLTIVHIP